MDTKHSLKETQRWKEWAGNMLGYIQSAVGNQQTIGYYWGWQHCYTSAQWSDWLDTKALQCNAAPWLVAKYRSLTEDYIHSPFGKYHLCFCVVNLLM